MTAALIGLEQRNRLSGLRLPPSGLLPDRCCPPVLEVVLLVAACVAILAICLLPQFSHLDHPRPDERPEDQDEAADGETGEVEHVPLAA